MPIIFAADHTFKETVSGDFGGWRVEEILGKYYIMMNYVSIDREAKFTIMEDMHRMKLKCIASEDI